MKKHTFLGLGLLLAGLGVQAQQAETSAISESITQPQVEMHIRFLASNELQGRDTGSPGLQIAARYIANYFNAYNIAPAPGMDNYFQPVPLQKITAPQSGQLKIDDNTYSLKQDFVLIGGGNTDLNGPVVYLNHGSADDLAKKDVKGKVVVVKAGMPGETSPQAWFYSAKEKRKILSEAGAKAVIELYNNPQLPWNILVNYLSGDQIQLGEATAEDNTIPHVWLQDAENKKLKQVVEAKRVQASLQVSGKENKQIKSQNVLGYIEGTDPELKNEVVLLSAHYDHVGITHGTTDADTIFNGARDNAVGTAAIMLAAKYLSKNPPKRSVLIAAWTAEEKGLLGSSWYSENPVVPLNQTVYNLNIDGAGYNDTTKVTVIGLERTAAEQDLIAAAQAFGLEAIQDPVPEQNLFDRSDNVNFAKKGVPAPTFSPGVTAFDDEIMKYYHQVTDNPESLNFNYITAYSRAFALAAQMVANAGEAPFWTAGDKYEAAGNILYNKSK
jgi:Iap family predicted aminopeptidase